MKINIINIPGNTYAGFSNIHISEVANLDNLCEIAECTRLIAEDVLDYFSSHEVDGILGNWISKLRHGGTIIIGGIDINMVAKALVNKQIDLTQANILLFGNQDSTDSYRKSALTSELMIQALKTCGLTILKKRTNNYKYIIEAERP